MEKYQLATFLFCSVLILANANEAMADLVDMTDVNGDPYAELKSQGLSEHIAVHDLHIESVQKENEVSEEQVPQTVSETAQAIAPTPQAVEAVEQAKADRPVEQVKTEAEPDFFTEDIF